jgi:hypothetical protein
MISFEYSFDAFRCDVIDLRLALTSEAETSRRRAAWRRLIEASIAREPTTSSVDRLQAIDVT